MIKDKYLEIEEIQKKQLEEIKNKSITELTSSQYRELDLDNRSINIMMS